MENISENLTTKGIKIMRCSNTKMMKSISKKPLKWVQFLCRDTVFFNISNRKFNFII